MNLENIRKEKKVTQIKLAQSLDVDQSTVSKWEKGHSAPSVQTLKKIAQLLDCTVDELVRED